MPLPLRHFIILVSILFVFHTPLPSAASTNIGWIRESLIECVKNYYHQGNFIGGDDWDYCTVSRESLFREADADNNRPGLQIYIVYVMRQAAAELRDRGWENYVQSDLTFCADTYNATGTWYGPIDNCSSHRGAILTSDMLHLTIQRLANTRTN